MLAQMKSFFSIFPEIIPWNKRECESSLVPKIFNVMKKGIKVIKLLLFSQYFPSLPAGKCDANILIWFSLLKSDFLPSQISIFSRPLPLASSHTLFQELNYPYFCREGKMHAWKRQPLCAGVEKYLQEHNVKYLLKIE